MSIYTKAFWKDAGERAVWTFAQTLGALLTVVVVEGGGLGAVDWQTVLSTAALAAIYAIVKALGVGRANPETGASTGTTIPRADVAAVETDQAGEYSAEEASPFPEGTPVDVVQESEYQSSTLSASRDQRQMDHMEDPF